MVFKIVSDACRKVCVLICTPPPPHPLSLPNPTPPPSDVDECLAASDSCEQVCTNNVGSFACSCAPGYLGTGNDCRGRHWGGGGGGGWVWGGGGGGGEVRVSVCI